MKRIIAITTLLLASGCSILQNPVAKKEAEILKLMATIRPELTMSGRRTVVHVLIPTARRFDVGRTVESVQNGFR